MNKYRLDRSAFTMQFKEAPVNYKKYWLSMSPIDRLNAAWYLISCAYDLPLNAPPPVDRKSFSMRLRK
jgi:hypothetical protein